MLIEQTLDIRCVCPCGYKLDYTPSPYITIERRVCPQCGRVHWVDDQPIDWDRVNKWKEHDND